MTLALAGCGNKEVEKTEKVSAHPKEEKILTVYSAGPDGLAANIQQAFEEKTGIKVEMFQGTTGKILSRLEAEKK